MLGANGNRYVDGLHEKIAILEKKLKYFRDDQSNWRLYDYDGDYITFPEFSGSGTPFTDSAPSHSYEKPLTISDISRNKTFEWDEGGDDKE